MWGSCLQNIHQGKELQGQAEEDEEMAMVLVVAAAVCVCVCVCVSKEQEKRRHIQYCNEEHCHNIACVVEERGGDRRHVILFIAV